MSGAAPIYTDAQQLCLWILGHYGDKSDPLSRIICNHAIALLETLVLALKGRRRQEHLEMADETLIILRIDLRLSHDLNILTHDQLLHILERADTIGRQLGGWLRSAEVT